MGQPEAASGTWGGQSRRFSPALSEAVGQPTARAGATYTAQQNELKILKALPRRSVEFLRKTRGIRCDFASCGTSVAFFCFTIFPAAVLFLLLSCAARAGGVPPLSNSLPCLTNVQQIRVLRPSEAQKGFP